MHRVETHLSYRIGLRTFSAMESRGVLGVPDAYELPPQPGQRLPASPDTQTLIRFKARVRLRRRTAAAGGERAHRGGTSQVVPFGTGYVGRSRRAPEPEPPSRAGGRRRRRVLTMLDVLVDRLRGSGPPAHQVWLPPLDEPPHAGPAAAAAGRRPGRSARARSADRVHGHADRPGRAASTSPFEQRRDLLTADLSGSGGHVGDRGWPAERQEHPAAHPDRRARAHPHRRAKCSSTASTSAAARWARWPACRTSAAWRTASTATGSRRTVLR